jgi:hypothetical protein
VAGGSLGPGIIIDCGRFLRRILQTDGDEVRVQPGVVAAQLEEHLGRRSRSLGVDPTNSWVTTVGGMIGRNSSGSRFPRYGAMSGRMISARVVLADGTILETVDRTGLWEAQTPQVFARDLLEQAFAARRDGQPTDEAQLVESLGRRITMVPGSPINLKITSPDDLRLAEKALGALPAPKFSGPAHPFAGDDVWR